MLSDELKTLAAPIVADICQHPFVTGLKDGKLPKEALITYVEQDTYFLTAFAKAYALALTKCPQRDAMLLLSEGITMSLIDESSAHRVLLRGTGALLEDLQNHPPRPETYAYTAHLLAVAETGTLPETIAALLPCPWTYEWVAKRLGEAITLGHPFYDWFQFYSPDSEDTDMAIVQSLFDLLDSQAVALTPAELQAVKAAFLRSCEYEWRFWDQAYHQLDWRYPIAH
ncbi:MAG: thiaminase II [Aerococcus sp.]|nr:thiaminase II [Aerococcus sp.]